MVNYPTIESYVKQVVDCIKNYSGRIYSAPVKAYGKDMLGRKLLAKWQVKNERAECLKAISEEAAMFGYNLSEKFTDLAIMTKTHEEPDDYVE